MMQAIPIYRYTRPDGGVTVSPIKPEGSYTETVRLVADEGKVLRLPDGTTTSCIDLDKAEQAGAVQGEADTEWDLTGGGLDGHTQI